MKVLKEFHDGFTTISFMKGFLDRISLGCENLEEKHLDLLDNYYTMVKGGIVFKIRSEITKSLKEEDVYGHREQDLYNLLIYSASELYKGQKKREKEKGEEELLKQLFTNQKYDLLKLKKIFDIYKNVLENKSLIIGESVRTQDEKDIGKIVKIEVGSEKSFMTVKGHGIHKSFREDNGTNLSRNLKNPISKRIKDWQNSLPHLMHRYDIPLEPLTIDDWNYGNPVILEISKEQIIKKNEFANFKLYCMNEFSKKDNISIDIEGE